MNYSSLGIEHRQKELNSILPKIHHTITTSLFAGFFVVIIATICIGSFFVYGIYNGILASTPNVDLTDLKPTGYSTYIYDISGNKISKLITSDSNRTYTTIDKIPVDVQHAFVAIEDKRFYEHHGIDPVGIVRAAYTGLTTHDFSQGASTITQQLIKNNVFVGWTSETGSAKWKRKIQEQYLAQELEASGKINKDTILELYLNTINLGQNTLGIQSASQRYFAKNSSELTLSEGAVLAAIPQNPTKYNPIRHPENNAERRRKVLKDMLEAGFIDQKTYDETLKDNVYDRIQEVELNLDVSPQTYFVDALVEQVINDLQTKCGMSQQQAYYQLYAGGLSIYSTQDSHIQNICDEYISVSENFPRNTKYSIDLAITIQDVSGNYINYDHNALLKTLDYRKNQFNSISDAVVAEANYKDRLLMEGNTIISERVDYIPQPQLSAVILDNKTGAVKAIIGGRGKKTNSLTFSRATDSMRQPGSTFKVLSTYLPAFDIGAKSLASTQVDEAFNYDNGRPVHNYYSGYKGTCTLRKGIEQSLNIVTVKTLTDITPEVGYEYLQRMGFTTLVEDQVKNKQVYTDVQQALALGGITYGVKNIELAGAYASIANYGYYNRPTFYSKILDHDGNVLLEPDPPKQIFKETTAFECLSAMEDVVTKGTGKACFFTGQAIAGKTGTTSDNKDVWFAGSTPYYTCTVWAGYDDNSVLNTADEKAMAKNAWHDIMESIHSDLMPKGFIKPETQVVKKVCAKSGKLAGDECEQYGYAYAEYFDDDNVPTEICISSHYTPPAQVPVPSIPTPEQQALLQMLLQQQAQQALTQNGDPNAPQQ